MGLSQGRTQAHWGKSFDDPEVRGAAGLNPWLVGPEEVPELSPMG